MVAKKLQVGSKGKDVVALQEKLNEQKPKKKLKIDGDFGPKTEEALKEIQKNKRIKSSGVADPKFFGLFEDEATIELSDLNENEKDRRRLVVKVTIGFWNNGTWKRIGGSHPDISAASGSAVWNKTQRELDLVKAAMLKKYVHKKGATGYNATKSIRWEVLGTD